jgi:hypothetical protein
VDADAIVIVANCAEALEARERELGRAIDFERQDPTVTSIPFEGCRASSAQTMCAGGRLGKSLAECAQMSRMWTDMRGRTANAPRYPILQRMIRSRSISRAVHLKSRCAPT